MGAAKKYTDKKALQALIPFNALAPAHFEEVARKTHIEIIRAGRYLFREGDRDNKSVYVLDGDVNLVSGKEVVGNVGGGTAAAKHPIANRQPRQVSARARTSCTVARVDTGILDVFLTWDQSTGYEVQEIREEQDGDWMTRMLQSEAFLKLPPANIQRLLISAESISGKSGDVIVRQGGEGKYFYIIKTGDCVVTRQASSSGKGIKLAELSAGDVFGEEALVSEEKRNATVTMATDGTLMRISKDDFLELLKEPLIEKVTWEEASKLDPLGTEWLDVRLPGEFEKSSLSGSRNIPLSTLRHEVDGLDRNTKYVICCDTGRRSASAAFILSQRGFEVYLLLDGLSQVPASELSGELEVSPGPAVPTTTAEIYDLDPGNANKVRETRGESTTDAIAPAELEQLRQKLDEAVTRNEMLEQNLEAVQLELRAINDRHRKETQEMRTTVREQTLEFEQDVQEARRKAKEMEDAAAELRNRLKQHEDVNKGKDDELRQSQDQVQQLEEELAQALDSAAKEAEGTRLEAQETLQRDLNVAHAHHKGLKGEHARQIAELDAQHKMREEALSETIRSLENTLEEVRGQGQEGESAGEQQMAELARQLQEQAVAHADQLSDIQHQLVATEEQLLEASNEAVTLRSQLEDQARIQQRLEENSERDVAEWDQHSESLRQLQEALASTKVQHNERESALQARIDALDAQLDEANQALETTRGTLLAENAALQEELESRNRVSADGDQQRRRLEAEVAQLSRQLQDVATQETDKLRVEMETALRERNALENALQQAEQRAREIESAAQALIQEDSVQQARETELETQVGTLKNRVSALQTERSAAEEAITALEKDLDVSRAALSREQRRVEGYKTRLEDSLDSVGQASAAEIEQLHAALDEAESRADAAERTAARLQESVEGIQSTKTEEHASLTAELTQLRQVTTADIEATHAELQRLRQELEIAKQGNAQEASEGEIERLRFLLEDARDQIARYQAGTDVDSFMMNSLPEALVSEGIDALGENSEEGMVQLQEELAAANKRFDEISRQHEDAREEADNLRHELEITNTKVKLAEASGSVQALRERDLADLDIDMESGSQRRQTGATRGLIFGLLVGIAGAAGYFWFDAHQKRAMPAAPETVVSPPVAPVTERLPANVEVTEVAQLPDSQEAAAAAIPVEESAPVVQEPPIVAEEIVPEIRATAVREFQDKLADYDTGPDMIELSGGDFLMGSGASSLDTDERPRHKVTVPAFAVAKYEVTFEQYDTFADDTGRARPDDEGWGRGSRPVVNVSWYDAVAYAKWLSEQTKKTYRLPTESEWEFIAGATSRSLYWWGTHIGSGRANCFNCGSQWDADRTAPTGSFTPNLFGMHDTAGNVQEWVQDCYHGSYEFAREDGSAWIETGCANKVVRGGGFNSAANTLRTTKRTQMAPGSRLETLGFRLARDL